MGKLTKGLVAPEWFDKNGLPLFKKPVVELIRSLYGHPESGALWDKHLKKHLVVCESVTNVTTKCRVSKCH